MAAETISSLRKRIDQLNLEILRLLSLRAQVAAEIGKLKERLGLSPHDPRRESEMLRELLRHNEGPLSDATVVRIFHAIFAAGMEVQVAGSPEKLLVRRAPGQANTVVVVGGELFGAGSPVVIAGPCSVESEEQIVAIAGTVKSAGVKVLRGGAFKPRTSPYAFQGLRREGVLMLERAAHEHGLATVTEVVDVRDLEWVAEHVDMVQIGTRNMTNFELLKAAGQCGAPVLLKRGFMSTIEEFMLAAEYVVAGGNPHVVLCERGIRTHERATRNTLDISAVPILRHETHLPVIVDISHSTGRKDIALPVALAALAAGADGLMVEVHDHPETALSDPDQQLNLQEFLELMDGITSWLRSRAPAPGAGEGSTGGR